MNLFYDTIKTPIGDLTIETNNTKILQIIFDWDNIQIQPNSLTQKCKTQLQEYFEGKRKVFDLPIQFNGTIFQKKVWNALLSIPYGKTSSYKEQAKCINNPKSVRAVGAANRKNKYTIVVPCHRIIGFNGLLTGYSGGIYRKKWLLEHEQKVAEKETSVKTAL